MSELNKKQLIETLYELQNMLMEKVRNTTPVCTSIRNDYYNQIRTLQHAVDVIKIILEEK